MGSITIKDFKFGLDRRRQRVAGLPGTLWLGKNVQISRGGDIERPKRFTPTYTLPTGATFGLAEVAGQLYVFGSGSTPAGMPAAVTYQQLASPVAAAMVQVLDAKPINGQIYVIARYADGNIHHFYNGARVTDWDGLADTNSTYATLARYMADLIASDGVVTATAVNSTITMTAVVPGTGFTIAKATTDFGGTSDQDITLATLQANIAPVVEVRATSAILVAAGSTGQIKDITANGTSLMQAAVNWTTDAPTTATLIAQQINDKSSTHGYTAVASSATITLSAPIGLGATANNYAIVSNTTGDIVLNCPSMSGGVTAVSAVAQIVQATFIGTPEPKDQFKITINGVDYVATGRASATGTSLYVSKSRMWSPAVSLWNYCELNTPSNWTNTNPSTGAGFINVANDAEGSEALVGAGSYMSTTAVFSRRNCRIYALDADATKISLAQPLDNTGALAARGILNYGAIDMFYLDESGIRSLRQRDASGAAFVNDIGTAIDPFIRAHMDTLTFGTIRTAYAVVEPREGRFWLAMGDRIYVLSYFPGSSISAWTHFEPGFSVTDFARVYKQLYVRAADTIYLYGGASGNDYPLAGEMVAQVDLPFVALDPPEQVHIEGIDAATTNAWSTKMLVDPNDETQTINCGILDGVTYPTPDNAAPGRSTHFALSLICSGAGPGTISSITLRHDGGPEPTL